MDDKYLAHYGILGMKWGVRRYQPYSVRGRKSGEGGREVGQAKQRSPSHEELIRSTNPKIISKYRDQLSDKELRDRVNRIQTEQQLDQLVANSSRKGKSASKRILEAVEGMAISAAAAAVFKFGKNTVKELSSVPISEFISTAEWMLTPWSV